MQNSIEKSYATRAEADRAVERLVQQVGLSRSDIFVTTANEDNSAGKKPGGGDARAQLEDERTDSPLAGEITISVDINDADKDQAIREALGNVSDS
ncbi:hypothetical protein [Novosphingobium kaempferiae]|uniref:hypothetical protein n=1 Tax=Novosphingobium kaempferiae TaxID=2896849 RepID=UPI001E3A8E70|nr:hypothetical protein [Novosphingobium kaempferiae]